MSVHSTIYYVTLLVAVSLAACDRSTALKGQANSTLTFYGLAVDENGKPLDGADFNIEVEAIPPGWTFETRGKPHAFSTVTAKSGRDGRFQIEIKAHYLRFNRVERVGYRHLFDLDADDSRARDNMHYMLNAWGDLVYKSDPEHPAVFVFVKDGIHEVSALPCKGGYDSANGNGTKWRLNNPGWPRKPSLADVIPKGAAADAKERTTAKPTVSPANPAPDDWAKALDGVPRTKPAHR